MIKHIRGDSFDFAGKLMLTIQGETVPDLAGWTGRSMIRGVDGALIAELTFEWLDAELSLIRIVCDDTRDWKVGMAKIDIQLTSPLGKVVSTSQSLIEIVGDVTFD